MVDKPVELKIALRAFPAIIEEEAEDREDESNDFFSSHLFLLSRIAF
jgi:hypothetical protein